MSLLLDALNRASKEKQKAAAAAMPPVVSTASLQWEAAAPVVTAPVAAQPIPATSPTPKPVELTFELELSPALALPVAAPEAVTAPVPVPTLAPMPTPIPKSTPETAASTDATPVAASAAAFRSVEPSGAKAVPEGRMAQDIRRAYENHPAASHGRRRRTVALGGLALGLALAIGSVFLGLWGDPATIIGLTGHTPVATTPIPAAPVEVSAPATPVTPVAEPLPAITVAPVAASAKPQEPVSPPVRTSPPAVVPHASPVAEPVSAPALVSLAGTAALTNDVVLRANASVKPTFASKTRGPSALEQGYAALLDGRLDVAAQAYGQALRANADERDALLGLAYINHQQGRREEAQAYYRKVLRQEPGNAVATAGLQSLESGSDPTLTASRASELAKRQPDSAAAMAMAGNAFVRDGLMADAAQAFARAQALEPVNPLHAYNHAVALDRLGQHAQALIQYEKVLRLSDTASVAVRAYQVEAVRLRVEQLRHALTAAAPATP